MQRFHRIEAGTVRMTTNLDVDLRELFVMACVRPLVENVAGKDAKASALMNLAAARSLFGAVEQADPGTDRKTEEAQGISALEQVKQSARNVLIGAPGAGKSTFLEWLNLQLAGAKELLIMGGKQAIPLLLRVRQLDPRNLPQDAGLIEKATASKDRATLMPPGWVRRQMQDGRILLMLDGLDEVDQELRDKCIIPWLEGLCKEYPNCRYLVSSRPVGYPPGALRARGFVECEVLDFGEPEIQEYTRHWCTAVRLARNEPEAEARQEGVAEGEHIVESFMGHPYIRNLARNPLMLSAICLVNYFEGGQLPEARAVLYRLCVEGLLHHWDQRRGIYSTFSLQDKLRTCREVALLMQAGDCAEYPAKDVQAILTTVLGSATRAEELLEHIRYRTGLLLERRPNIFAFAHLTFQEYLAAQAIHEGNRLGIDAEHLAREHADARWKEVIALYCGLASGNAARHLLERLIEQADTTELANVLSDAYLSAGPELTQDVAFRRRVMERVAVSPARATTSSLERFPPEEVAPIANLCVGITQNRLRTSEAYKWLRNNWVQIDVAALNRRLRGWRTLEPQQTAELSALLHGFAPDAVLAELAAC